MAGTNRSFPHPPSDAMNRALHPDDIGRVTGLIVLLRVVATGTASHPLIRCKTLSFHIVTICPIAVAPSINPITIISTASAISYFAFAARPVVTSLLTFSLNIKCLPEVECRQGPSINRESFARHFYFYFRLFFLSRLRYFLHGKGESPFWAFFVVNLLELLPFSLSHCNLR